MSYRIQIELGRHDPLKDKVLLHYKFLRHFQKRKLDAGARGRTNWMMEFCSERTGFTILWNRQPRHAGRFGPRFNEERLIGWVVIRFSKKEIDLGGSFIVAGDWEAIERVMNKVAA
jgi:hypothetical protein